MRLPTFKRVLVRALLVGVVAAGAFGSSPSLGQVAPVKGEPKRVRVPAPQEQVNASSDAEAFDAVPAEERVEDRAQAPRAGAPMKMAGTAAAVQRCGNGQTGATLGMMNNSSAHGHCGR